MAAPATQIPAPRVPFLDPQTNMVSPQWFLWFNNLYSFTGSGVGILATANGGTGLGTAPANGQLLIGDTGTYKLNTLTQGTGINVANGPGSITVNVANTGVVAGSYGTASTVPNYAVNAQGQLTSSVSTTIAIAANQITSGEVPILRGGTGASTASGARTNLGLGTMATQNIGASGTFTTVDLKTVTVVNGIITSIV